jgi:hypothetical protein
VVHQPAWRELRKVAGPAFETGTRLAVSSPADVYLSNRENLLRWIDVLSASLDSVREAVAAGDAEALDERLERVWRERQAWLADREIGDWTEGPRPEMPPRPGLLDSFFGGFLRRRTKEES